MGLLCFRSLCFVHDIWEQERKTLFYVMSSKFSFVDIVFYSKSLKKIAGFAVGVQNCWSGHKGFKEHFVGAMSSDRTAVLNASRARMDRIINWSDSKEKLLS